MLVRRISSILASVMSIVVLLMTIKTGPNWFIFVPAFLLVFGCFILFAQNDTFNWLGGIGTVVLSIVGIILGIMSVHSVLDIVLLSFILVLDGIVAIITLLMDL